jgi:hypothetical protein
MRLLFCRYWNLRIDLQIVHGIVKDKGQRFPKQVSERRKQNSGASISNSSSKFQSAHKIRHS